MDIDFAISKQVDFLAVSFVKSPEIIKNLRSYIQVSAMQEAQKVVCTDLLGGSRCDPLYYCRITL